VNTTTEVTSKIYEDSIKRYDAIFGDEHDNQSPSQSSEVNSPTRKDSPETQNDPSLTTEKANFSRVPEFLRQFKNWVNWNAEKIPINPNSGEPASTTDKGTWSSFEQAYKTYGLSANGTIMGIGFVFTETGLSGIDLDKCRNPETGQVEQWAVDIVDRLKSYTEISPSGSGLHIIAQGKLPGPGRKSGHLELYDTGRYFTITGNTLPGEYGEINNRQKEVNEFYQEHFKGKPASPREVKGMSPTREDDLLITQASMAANGEKFSDLMNGNWQKYYSSQSEGDLSLCNELAFWTQDPKQIDRILRTSKLMRPKWDEKRGDSTYGWDTILKALSDTTEHYEPKPESKAETIPINTEPNMETEQGQGEVQKKSITNDFRIWFENCEGSFSLSQIYADLYATTRQERNAIQQDLHRLLEKGKVERLRKQGEYRKIKCNVEKILMPSVKPIPLPILFPCNIENYLKTYRGNVIVIGGSPNSGKTAYCLNVAKLNMDRFKVNYISSEMRGEEIYERLEGFQENCIQEMFEKIDWIPCTSDFQDVINPDALNIIDYLEIPDGEFFKVQDQIRKMFDKLKDGIAIICIQQNKGAELPKGGTGSIEKARIALSIDNHLLTVVKGKLWKRGTVHHNLTRRFKLWAGVNFTWEAWGEGAGASSLYN